jgi:hypothetical protein
VLHVDAPRAAIGGFADARTAAAFGKRAGALLGSWCCSATAETSGGRHRKPSGGGSEGGRHTPSALLSDIEADGGLHGDAFKLRFRPRLGVVRSGGGGGADGGGARGAAAGRTRWHVVRAVNNVFGRAALHRDTACCRYDRTP